MSQAPLRVMHAEPYPDLPTTPPAADGQAVSVYYAKRLANRVARAERELASARGLRAAWATALHCDHGWSFRKVAKLLHVSEAAVRLMVAKFEDSRGAAE